MTLQHGRNQNRARLDRSIVAITASRATGSLPISTALKPRPLRLGAVSRIAGRNPRNQKKTAENREVFGVQFLVNCGPFQHIDRTSVLIELGEEQNLNPIKPLGQGAL